MSKKTAQSYFTISLLSKDNWPNWFTTPPTHGEKSLTIVPNKRFATSFLIRREEMESVTWVCLFLTFTVCIFNAFLYCNEHLAIILIILFNIFVEEVLGSTGPKWYGNYEFCGPGPNALSLHSAMLGLITPYEGLQTKRKQVSSGKLAIFTNMVNKRKIQSAVLVKCMRRLNWKALNWFYSRCQLLTTVLAIFVAFWAGFFYNWIKSVLLPLLCRYTKFRSINHSIMWSFDLYISIIRGVIVFSDEAFRSLPITNGRNVVKYLYFTLVFSFLIFPTTRQRPTFREVRP